MTLVVTKIMHRFLAIVRNKWFFPILLIGLLTLCTAMRVSGTSVGQYYVHLYGADVKDSSLMFGEPRKIRSDEWGVNTPLTMSQVNEDFPIVNTSAGGGQDIALTFDVPYAEWSTLFKPQNWAFFVMPVEYAFAFKWWLMATVLMLSCYLFVLTLLPGRYAFASLLSVAVFCSPFLHWWYQAGSILSLAYALLITSLIIRILKEKSRIHICAGLAALTYFLTCFVFIAYVPFIIPLALVVSSFIAGHIINEFLATIDRMTYLKRASMLMIPVVVASTFFLLFLRAHSGVIQALGNSVYPGDRIEQSGGFDMLQLFGGYYNLQLQDDVKAAALNLNQSEASSFVLIFPLLIPLLMYIFAWRKKHNSPVDWRIVLLSVLMLLFVVRLFVPASEVLFNALGLNRIPHNRLLIALGLLNVFSVIIATQHLAKVSVPRILVLISGLWAFVIVVGVGIGFKLQFVGYIENTLKIMLIGLIFACIASLFVAKRYVLAIAIFASYGLISTVQVNPLYRGLGFLYNSALSSEIRRIGDAKGRWVVGDEAAFVEELPAAHGIDTLSGVYAYPQLMIWSGIGDDPATRAVYNRYAHVFFSVEQLSRPAQKLDSYFDPPALDAFRVHTDPCGQFLKQEKVRYVLMTKELVSSCVHKISTIPYPVTTFHIYELTTSK